MLEQAAPTRREAMLLGGLAAVLALVLLARWWAWRAPGPPTTTTAIAGASSGIVLDVNTAAWWELDALPGVGETLARRIVEDRKRNGPFASLDDLSRIRGISTATVSRWRPYLTIERAESTKRE